MKRLWIVQAQFRDGSWDICDFGIEQYASTDYYTAHELKRRKCEYLQNKVPRTWSKKSFRVVEYKPKES